MPPFWEILDPPLTIIVAFKYFYICRIDRKTTVSCWIFLEGHFIWQYTISNVKFKLLFDLFLDRLIGLLTCSPQPPPISLAQVKMKPNTAQADWSGHLSGPFQNTTGLSKLKMYRVFRFSWTLTWFISENWAFQIIKSGMVTTVTINVHTVTFPVIVTENTFTLLCQGRHLSPVIEFLFLLSENISNTRHGVFLSNYFWAFVTIHWIQWKSFRENSTWHLRYQCIKEFPIKFLNNKIGLLLVINTELLLFKFYHVVLIYNEGPLAKVKRRFVSNFK